jgi:hypothetical protein
VDAAVKEILLTSLSRKQWSVQYNQPKVLFLVWHLVSGELLEDVY